MQETHLQTIISARNPPSYGSVRLVVNAETGEVVARRDYDAFGRERNRVGDAGIPFGYAGGWVDEDTGTLRFGAREYSPEWGRWLSPDPAGFGAGDGNLYGYVLGMPHWAVDPSGMFSKEDFIGALVAGGEAARLVLPQLGRAVGGGIITALSSPSVGVAVAGVTVVAIVAIGGYVVISMLTPTEQTQASNGPYRAPANVHNPPTPNPHHPPESDPDPDDECVDPCERIIRSVLNDMSQTARSAPTSVTPVALQRQLLDQGLGRSAPLTGLSSCVDALAVNMSCQARCIGRVDPCALHLADVHNSKILSGGRLGQLTGPYFCL